MRQNFDASPFFTPPPPVKAVPFFERGTRLAEPEGDRIIHNAFSCVLT